MGVVSGALVQCEAQLPLRPFKRQLFGNPVKRLSLYSITDDLPMRL